MAALRIRRLAPSVLFSVSTLAALACSSAPPSDVNAAVADHSTVAPANTIIPIHFPPRYPGPAASQTSFPFGSVTGGHHYEQTVWFTITQEDVFTASISNAYGGAVHITNMQAWWTLGQCHVGSSDPECFDYSYSGAGWLHADAGEVVGVTVSIDPTLATGAVNSQLVVTGTNADWTERLPITAAPLSCGAVSKGFDVVNSPRYNDLRFTVSSTADIRWDWKVTSANLNAQGTLAQGSHGGFVDVATDFKGPPWAVSPNTYYMVSFYPGGYPSVCTPINIRFLTPVDPTPSCVVDHACPGDLPNGDDGAEDAPPGGFVACGAGGSDDCCPFASCDPAND
ncbi:MAG TPA: hypothetical protein VGI39_37950 [Polyangiaceae bacterium]|jgi:hypothetical protein